MTVHRQVLAQPSLDLAEKTWARLSDGTPLVTAQRLGNGWLVLVHTTANTGWSNLSISGLFVAMLRRIVALSQGTVAQKDGPPLAPLQVLDGKGRLQVPPSHVLPIATSAFEKVEIGPKHPPGFYGTQTARRALNLSSKVEDSKVLTEQPSWVRTDNFEAAREIDLRPWMFGAALILFLTDLIATLALRGMFKLRRAGTVASIIVLISTVFSLIHSAQAQILEKYALEASLQTRIAYVLTGEKEVDEISQAGLEGLRTVLAQRTAAELGSPIGVDITNNELSFFSSTLLASHSKSKAAVEKSNHSIESFHAKWWHYFLRHPR